jgi:hypothetical protein
MALFIPALVRNFTGDQNIAVKERSGLFVKLRMTLIRTTLVANPLSGADSQSTIERICPVGKSFVPLCRLV